MTPRYKRLFLFSGATIICVIAVVSLFQLDPTPECPVTGIFAGDEDIIRAAVAPFVLGTYTIEYTAADGSRKTIEVRSPSTPQEFLEKFPDCCKIVPLDGAHMIVPDEREIKRRGIAAAVQIKYQKTDVLSDGIMEDYPVTIYSVVDNCGKMYDYR